MPVPLDDSASILDLYMEYVGRSEVPQQFHVWSCFSLIAAAVSNRVWLAKGAKRLAPNLYIALIGPSAIGKGEAIDAMLEVGRNQRRVNVYKGKTTAPHMLDILAQPARGDREPWSHLYLITPELAWSMGKGDWADALVKQLTELYGGSTDAIQEGTRTGGKTRIPPGTLCINWLAGSTREWLHEVIPPANISGGFFGRIAAIPAEYDFSVRYRRPILSPDRDVLLALLRQRVWRLGQLAGEFYETPEAVAAEDAWYMLRPAPTDPDLMAAWKRQHDFLLKLAMCLSLSEGESLTITAAQMAQSQRLSDAIVKAMPAILGTAQMTVETRGLGIVEDFMRRIPGAVPHSMLLKQVSRRGYDAESLRRIVQTLFEMGKLRVNGGASKRTYEWLGGAKLVPLAPQPLDSVEANGVAYGTREDEE